MLFQVHLEALLLADHILVVFLLRHLSLCHVALASESDEYIFPCKIYIFLQHIHFNLLLASVLRPITSHRLLMQLVGEYQYFSYLILFLCRLVASQLESGTQVLVLIINHHFGSSRRPPLLQELSLYLQAFYFIIQVSL